MYLSLPIYNDLAIYPSVSPGAPAFIMIPTSDVHDRVNDVWSPRPCKKRISLHSPCAGAMSSFYLLSGGVTNAMHTRSCTQCYATPICYLVTTAAAPLTCNTRPDTVSPKQSYLPNQIWTQLLAGSAKPSGRQQLRLEAGYLQMGSAWRQFILLSRAFASLHTSDGTPRHHTTPSQPPHVSAPGRSQTSSCQYLAEPIDSTCHYPPKSPPPPQSHLLADTPSIRA
jgi:hypothetical protein